MIALDAHPRNVFSEYWEFPVPASLANRFLCFWKQVIIGSGEYAHLVLPDACIDIVFVSDDPPIVVGPLFASRLARRLLAYGCTRG